jgi:cation-transporting P-type ATPase C
MNQQAALRVAPVADGVAISSSEIFGEAAGSQLREFLARAFSVEEVQRVELRRSSGIGRISFGAVTEPASIWKKLSRALRAHGSVTGKPRVSTADTIHLDVPADVLISISRVGAALTTWRVQHYNDSSLFVSHPALRARRDLAFRLEEELAAIFGVTSVRASAFTGAVSVRFDKRALTLEQLVRELEKLWPRVLRATDAPPSGKRLTAAAGLLGLAFTGQYLVPAVRPLARAGATLYSAPNVVNAAKEWSRGQVGLYTMYSAGLGFMLVSGMPFASTLFAVLSQCWPQLTHRQFVRSQRRLFAAQRRRTVSAWLGDGAGDQPTVHVDELSRGDVITVRPGETIPVDGMVTQGLGLVAGAPLSAAGLEDKAQGDAVTAGAIVRAGQLSIRVERSGGQTWASAVDAHLPRAAFENLPSLIEAERVANRNAKAALGLSALALGATRTLRLSQALIRPDYITGARLSAQLSALQGVAQGLWRGALFRDPGALDRLASADVFVFDDGAGLETRRLEVATIETGEGSSAPLVASYALAAYPRAQDDRTRALEAYIAQRVPLQPRAAELIRQAGVTRYRTRDGGRIEVATLRYLDSAKIDVPAQLRRKGTAAAAAPPLWVLRDGAVIGVVTFARTGELVGQVVMNALKAQRPRARFVALSSERRPALGHSLDIELVRDGLSSADKVDLIRGLGRNTVWIGDGSNARASGPIAASTVTVSVSPLGHTTSDTADVLLPYVGLSALPVITELAHAHTRRLTRDYRTLYTVNLLGVAGAVSTTRFSSLQAGLLSNAGTGLIYVRHARELARLSRAVERAR